MTINPAKLRAANQHSKPGHDYDEDSICRRCGFDGAEWWHWKNNTYEGRASNHKEPLCNVSERLSNV